MSVESNPRLKPPAIPQPFIVNSYMSSVEVNPIYRVDPHITFQPPDINEYQSLSSRTAIHQYFISQPPEGPCIWETELSPPDTIFNTLETDEDIFYHIYRKYDTTCPCPLVLPTVPLSTNDEDKTKKGKRGGRTKQCISTETDKYESLRLEMRGCKSIRTTPHLSPPAPLPNQIPFEQEFELPIMSERRQLFSTAPLPPSNSSFVPQATSLDASLQFKTDRSVSSTKSKISCYSSQSLSTCENTRDEHTELQVSEHAPFQSELLTNQDPLPQISYQGPQNGDARYFQDPALKFRISPTEPMFEMKRKDSSLEGDVFSKQYKKKRTSRTISSDSTAEAHPWQTSHYALNELQVHDEMDKEALDAAAMMLALRQFK